MAATFPSRTRWWRRPQLLLEAPVPPFSCMGVDQRARAACNYPDCQEHGGRAMRADWPLDRRPENVRMFMMGARGIPNRPRFGARGERTLRLYLGG